MLLGVAGIDDIFFIFFFLTRIAAEKHLGVHTHTHTHTHKHTNTRTHADPKRSNYPGGLPVSGPSWVSPVSPGVSPNTTPIPTSLPTTAAMGRRPITPGSACLVSLARRAGSAHRRTSSRLATYDAPTVVVIGWGLVVGYRYLPALLSSLLSSPSPCLGNELT